MEAQTLSLARLAMATRFEFLLRGDNPVSLRAAGEEALDEIERLEAQLSIFKPTSEISRLNQRASREAVPVSPPVFRLLTHARELSLATEGAFDPTVAPLLRCWGFHAGRGQVPSNASLKEALLAVGMHHVELDPDHFTVRFTKPGMMLDLGAIGKGYAIDRAIEILREAGVRAAFIHGGTSSCYGFDDDTNTRVDQIAAGQKPSPPNPPTTTTASTPWRVELAVTGKAEAIATHSQQPSPTSLDTRLAVIDLQHNSLGVSAIWGRSFRSNGRDFGHVIDPRTGQPVCRAWMAAVRLPSATESDALSTALLTLGPSGLNPLQTLRPDCAAVVVDSPTGSDAPHQVGPAPVGRAWFAHALNLPLLRSTGRHDNPPSPFSSR